MNNGVHVPPASQAAMGAFSLFCRDGRPPLQNAAPCRHLNTGGLHTWNNLFTCFWKTEAGSRGNTSARRPAPPPVEQVVVSRPREKSNGPRHAAGKDAPAYRPKAQRPSQGPRHGNWAPAPQAAVQRPAAEPAPMELTAGSALYAEVTALLEQEPSPRREASRRAPDPAAAKAPARKTAAPPQKSTPPAGGPQPHSGSFGAAIPIELGSLFPLRRKPQGKPGDSPLVPRTEF